MLSSDNDGSRISYACVRNYTGLNVSCLEKDVERSQALVHSSAVTSPSTRSNSPTESSIPTDSVMCRTVAHSTLASLCKLQVSLSSRKTVFMLSHGTTCTPLCGMSASPPSQLVTSRCPPFLSSCRMSMCSNVADSHAPINSLCGLRVQLHPVTIFSVPLIGDARFSLAWKRKQLLALWLGGLYIAHLVM
jgi:hypothetical protein